MIRTIAGSQRKLTEDMNLSPLQAIDRLQKLHVKFKDYWVTPPWLVLPDCYCLPAQMTVASMMDEIATHGSPIGIVGMALLPGSRRYAVLKMAFKKSRKNLETIEVSGQAAMNKLEEWARKVPDLHKAAPDKDAN